MSILEEEIQKLMRKLEEKEDALQKAGQYGLQLLDDKMELQSKLEEHRIEMTAIIEGLEQEKYSLQREVELKVRMLDSLHSEFDHVKNQQKHLLEQQQRTLKRSHADEIFDLKSKMEKMKSDLDESCLLEKQMRHKLELQSQTLSSKTEELRRLMECSNKTKSSEITELKINLDLESSVATLVRELQESHFKEQQLQLTNTIIKRQMEALSNDKEEKEKELSSLYNALEKSRKVGQDLQIQLEQALQQAQDPNSKGNSLFSEVEDKRVEMEKQLIGMKVQYQSLQKQNAFTKQQMLRMKVQISNLMQLQGARADPSQLERLQFMLSEKNSEIEILMRKVQELEKVEMTPKDHCFISTSKPTDFVDETYYTDLLKIQLSNSKKTAETIKEELSMARLKALSESQRVLELERKLFGAENALKQVQSDNIKLQVKLEELQMKYEPDDVKKAQAQKRKWEKFPVTVTEERSYHCVKETEPNETNKDMISKTRSCSAENPSDITQSPSLALLGDGKCVRICEDSSISVPDLLWSSVAAQKCMDDHLKYDTEEKWRTMEQKKYHMPVHINSENTMETQCAQQ